MDPPALDRMRRGKRGGLRCVHPLGLPRATETSARIRRRERRICLRWPLSATLSSLDDLRERDEAPSPIGSNVVDGGRSGGHRDLQQPRAERRTKELRRRDQRRLEILGEGARVGGRDLRVDQRQRCLRDQRAGVCVAPVHGRALQPRAARDRGDTELRDTALDELGTRRHEDRALHPGASTAEPWLLRSRLRHVSSLPASRTNAT